MESMTVRTIAVTAVLLALISACTHKPFHPHKTDREWTADNQACEQWVREGIRDEPDTYDNFDEMRLIRRCMKDKGWQWERTDWWRFDKKAAE